MSSSDSVSISYFDNFEFDTSEKFKNYKYITLEKANKNLKIDFFIISKNFSKKNFLSLKSKQKFINQIILYNYSDISLIKLIANLFPIVGYFENELELFKCFNTNNKKYFNNYQTHLEIFEKVKVVKVLKTEDRLKSESIQKIENSFKDLIQSEKKNELKRELIKRFAHLIFGSKTIDESLTIFKEYLKKSNFILNPILIISDFKKQTIYYFDSFGLKDKNIVNELKYDDISSLQSRLSVELSRPISKLEVIQLPKLNSKHNIVIILESVHKSNDSEKHFLHYFISLFSTHLLCEVSEETLNNLILGWNHVFSNLEDPIAIINNKRHILRSNKVFEKYKDTLLKDNKYFKINELEYELNHFAIGEAKYLLYYQNISNIKNLKYKISQNKKIISLGKFSSKLAHELKNPLAGIKLLTEMTINLTNDEIEKSDLGEIINAINRCESIIKNFINFTKTESFDELEKISLNNVVNTTLSFVKTMKQKIKINFDNIENELYILANFSLLQQVVLNLINNSYFALENVENGKISIILTTNQESAKLSIVDNGMGIQKDILDKVFLPFETTKKSTHGTGLGLYICKKIVEQFNGTIKLTSHLHKGTRVDISFPLKSL